MTTLTHPVIDALLTHPTHRGDYVKGRPLTGAEIERLNDAVFDGQVEVVEIYDEDNVVLSQGRRWLIAEIAETCGVCGFALDIGEAAITAPVHGSCWKDYR